MSQLEGLVVRRTTTAQQVADGLSERILNGAFAPGERLRESAIAAELGVARNTVREAVRILELGGLVRHEVNRGAVIIPATVEELDALYTARERVETAAVRRVPSADQLAAIEQAYERLVQAAEARDPRRIVDGDLAFHSAVVGMLGSARLDAFFRDLTRELRFYLMVLSVEDREFEDPQRILAEHTAILAAIRSGEPEVAVERVRFHLDTNARRLGEILAERGQ